MDLNLRSSVMRAKDPQIVYQARNISCAGGNVFDTGFAPFSADNLSKDFRITLRITSFTKTSGSNNQDVVLGCKYEGTKNGLSYPGIYIRLYNSNTNQFDIGGYNYWHPNIADLLGKNLYIWRKNGTFYGQIEGNARQTLSVRSTEFDQNIILGAGEQTSGTYFRPSTCEIEFVRLEVANAEPQGWKTYISNDFNTYSQYVDPTGCTLDVAADGSYFYMISNGQNQNSTHFYNNPRFAYTHIRNKHCRVTWDIECSDPITLDGTNDSGNIGLALYSVQNQTSGKNTANRKSAKNVATLANFLGRHTVEFIPAEWFEGLTLAPYFGWCFGFRSTTSGRWIKVNEFTFEVWE